LSGFVGLASTHGSTSLFRKFVPPAASPEMSQPANGLATDTTCRGLRVNTPAAAGDAIVSVNAATSPTIRRERIRASSLEPAPPSPYEPDCDSPAYRARSRTANDA
jgi:hypothetical protein